MEADKDEDGKISFDEFCQMVAGTVNFLRAIRLILGCRVKHDIGRSLNDDYIERAG
jgi:Ca2+-binding EF-hand superfamily protein